MSINKKRKGSIEPFLFDSIGVIGFEPTTSYSRSMRATKLRYTPMQ